MSRFDYLVDKIENASFEEKPFRHVYIDSLFTPKDFEEIISSSEISLPQVVSDTDLFSQLNEHGYEVIRFPGCITDVDEYCRWHSAKRLDRRVNSSCEGFGVVLRLKHAKTDVLNEIKEFMLSHKFKECIAEKLGICSDECTVDNGIQKYLDGYEISPHPDIRRKAATFMVNINDALDSEQRNHHTHYLTFSPEYQYVEAFWQGNPSVERCWVPWTWCKTYSQQKRNNSFVLFAPGNDTMHAVKAEYDHLCGQRTQLYGNLWYRDEILGTINGDVKWEQIDIVSQYSEQTNPRSSSSIISAAKKFLPRAGKK